VPKINSTIRANANYNKTKQIDSNLVIIDARMPQETFSGHNSRLVVSKNEEIFRFLFSKKEKVDATSLAR
jgi:hypothetical protein